MVNKSSQFINKANVHGRVNTFISVCSSACEKMGGRRNIFLFFSVAQSFPFYLFNGGGTSSRLPIGCVLIQSQPEEGECCFVFFLFFQEEEEKKNINFYFIFIFNLLFCCKKKKKPHGVVPLRIWRSFRSRGHSRYIYKAGRMFVLLPHVGGYVDIQQSKQEEKEEKEKKKGTFG